ncbi:hypothetical protein, partial [Bartonella sp. AA85SXKL]
RFLGATEDIRRSADEIRSELSKINNDLNESVQKLPEKTKETTQTIRHALNEQITALKDLVSVIQKNDQKNVKEQLIPTISSSSTLNKPDIA